MKKSAHILLILLALSVLARAEISVNGGIQHDGLFGVNDAAISAEYDFPYLSNSYLDLGIQSEYVTAGMRLEVMPKPMPGFESSFAGAGIGNLFVQGRYKWATITVGDVYAQYGSGLIMRLYEERALGIDNSLRGGKIVLKPYKGLHFEAIGGKQRVFWDCYNTSWGLDYTKGAVVGGNAELEIDQWSEQMQQRDIRLLIGLSYVSKYEPTDTVYASYSPLSIYNMPRWTAGADARIKLQIKDWSVLAEYARRANDPSADNAFSYKDSEALLLSGSYSRKGLSVLLQMKRSENMSFRSDRMKRGTGAMLNYLPAFAATHTYALAALYPYATQTAGEWAWQGEIRYTWKKKTPFGGRYGTTMHLNASHIRGIGDKWLSVSKEAYYTDIHIDLHKRITEQWWLNAMYMYQTYNQQVVEGHGDIIRSNIFVLDAKYQINDNVAMRAEVQYLYSRQGEGQWIYGLYELSLWNCLTLSASDMYNIGGKNYWQAGATFQMKGHRLQAGFVRQRAGYNCSGGVCRYVPAQKGATINYSYNF